MAKITKEAALLYHSQGKPGKIEVVPTKPYSTQTDLSLAYSPGVAEPCLEIEKNPQDAYKYTAKGNLVAVISNGTAVLGLGDIGALSGKPLPSITGLPLNAPISPSPRTAVPLEITATRLPLAVYLYASCGFFSISRHGSATPGE